MIVENDVKKCLGCDNSIDLTGKKNYCSNKCYRKNYSKEWYSKNKVVNSKTLKLCKCCGNSFLPKTKRSKYCSVKCSGKEWFREKTGFYNIKPRNCEYCEKLFIPNKGKNTKCCSGSCNSKLWAKNNKDKVKDNKDKNQKWSSLKRKYGLSFELFYINNDGNINYKKMMYEIDKYISEGIINPKKVYDRYNHLKRDIQKNVYIQNYINLINWLKNIVRLTIIGKNQYIKENYTLKNNDVKYKLKKQIHYTKSFYNSYDDVNTYSEDKAFRNYEDNT